MGYGQGKSEAGHKRDHSAMALWVTHQEAKTEARKRRRLVARRLERIAVKVVSGAGSSRSCSGCD